MKYQFAQQISYFLILHLGGSNDFEPILSPIMIPIVASWPRLLKRLEFKGPSIQHIPRDAGPLRLGVKFQPPKTRCFIFASNFRFLEDSGSFLSRCRRLSQLCWSKSDVLQLQILQKV